MTSNTACSLVCTRPPRIIALQRMATFRSWFHACPDDIHSKGTTATGLPASIHVPRTQSTQPASIEPPFPPNLRFSQALKDTEKKELAAAMHEMTFSKDETIFEQGATQPCTWKIKFQHVSALQPSSRDLEG